MTVCLWIVIVEFVGTVTQLSAFLDDQRQKEGPFGKAS